MLSRLYSTSTPLFALDLPSRMADDRFGMVNNDLHLLLLWRALARQCPKVHTSTQENDLVSTGWVRRRRLRMVPLGWSLCTDWINHACSQVLAEASSYFIKANEKIRKRSLLSRIYQAHFYQAPLAGLSVVFD
jgi:hypothetical protein